MLTQATQGDEHATKTDPAARAHEESTPLATVERYHPLVNRSNINLVLYFCHLSRSKVRKPTKKDSALTPQRASSGVVPRLCRGFPRPAQGLLVYCLDDLIKHANHIVDLPARVGACNPGQVTFQGVALRERQGHRRSGAARGGELHKGEQ